MVVSVPVAQPSCEGDNYCYQQARRWRREEGVDGAEGAAGTTKIRKRCRGRESHKRREF